MPPVEEVERRVEKFIKSVPGILALLFGVTYCVVFIAEVVVTKDTSGPIAVNFGTILTGIVSFFIAQKGAQDAAKQTASTLAKTNGHSTPPPAAPAAPTPAP